MEKNKTGKYVKYAIGEIILVVIGILIALSINNWNEKRKTNEDIIILYKNAKQDLNIEQSKIKIQINWFKEYQDLHYQLYKESIGKLPHAPNQDFTALLWTNTTRPVIQENYGSKVGEMTNKQIQELFRDYIWRETLVLDARDEWNEHKSGVMKPYFAKYGIYDNSVVFNDKPYEFSALNDNGSVLNVEKLRAQYGTVEFDQILYELRHKASWYLHCLNNQKSANEKLRLALDAYIHGDLALLNSIEPVESYY